MSSESRNKSSIQIYRREITTYGYKIFFKETVIPILVIMVKMVSRKLSDLIGASFILKRKHLGKEEI